MINSGFCNTELCKLITDCAIECVVDDPGQCKFYPLISVCCICLLIDKFATGLCNQITATLLFANLGQCESETGTFSYKG